MPELHAEAIAFVQPVALLAYGNLHRAVQHPDLLVDTRVASSGFEGDAGAGREMHFDDLHGLRHARRRDVPPNIAGSGIPPLQLVLAPGDRSAGQFSR